MNIKITEVAGRWNLQATGKGSDGKGSDLLIYVANRRTREQINALLPVILADSGVPQNPAPGERSKNFEDGARRALSLLLVALDNTIEDVMANHDSMEHRGESRGEECWRQFAPSDIRDMIHMVAHGLGLKPLSRPQTYREDKPCSDT